MTSWKAVRSHKYFWHGVYGLLSAVGWFVIQIVSGEITGMQDFMNVTFQSLVAAAIGAGLRLFQDQYITKPEKAEADKKNVEQQKQALIAELLDHTVNTVPVIEKLKQLGWPSSMDDLSLQYVNMRGAQLEKVNFNVDVPQGMSMEWWQNHGPKNARVLGWDPGYARVDSPGSDWSGANLLAANLRGAMLFRCKLVNAHLQRTDLSYANLEGADLTGANTTQVILTGATWDQYTILPDGNKCTSQEQFEGIASFAYVAPILMARMQNMQNQQ